MDNSFDLDLSMYPSFVSSFYKRVKPGVWMRIIPPRHVLLHDKSLNMLCCEGRGCDEKLLEHISGAWCAQECMAGLEGSPFRLKVKSILDLYDGLTVSASPGDAVLLAIAVTLSRRTSYQVNVRRWVRYLLTGGFDLERIKARALRLRSPQPRLLAEVLEELVEAMQGVEDCKKDPWSLRRRLLEIRGIGPKTADAILLFAGCTTWVAPADIHLARLLARLGLKGKTPSKKFCGRNTCMGCPYSRWCLSGIVVREFKGAAGLVQTLAYVYDTLGVNWRQKLEEILSNYYSS